MQVTTAARPESLEEFHSLMHALWESDPSVGPRERMAFETVVAEIGANIIEHAAASSDVEVTFIVDLDRRRIEAHFHDGGRPFEEPTEDHDDPLVDHGRGLFMARTLADTLTYERDGETNHWQIVVLRHDSD